MKVNDEDIALPAPVPLGDFLQGRFDVSRIAVELNGEIVPKSQYQTTLVCNADTLEVISFVGGG